MIKSKSDYIFYLKRDKEASGKKESILNFSFVKDPIWYFQKFLRKLEYYSNCKKGLIFRLYTFFLYYRFKKLSIKLNFSIPINTIGPGLHITHIGSIIIHPNARIGENLRLNVGVVIGRKGSNSDVPIIGNNVVIEAGSKIFGSILIADGVHIGANAVVNKSIKVENCVVAGIPAKIIKQENKIHNKFSNDV